MGLIEWQSLMLDMYSRSGHISATRLQLALWRYKDKIQPWHTEESTFFTGIFTICDLHNDKVTSVNKYFTYVQYPSKICTHYSINNIHCSH